MTATAIPVYEERARVGRDNLGLFVTVARTPYRPLQGLTSLREGQRVRVHHVQSARTTRVLPASGPVEVWGSGDPVDLPPDTFGMIDSNPALR